MAEIFTQMSIKINYLSYTTKKDNDNKPSVRLAQHNKIKNINGSQKYNIGCIN